MPPHALAVDQSLPDWANTAAENRLKYPREPSQWSAWSVLIVDRYKWARRIKTRQMDWARCPRNFMQSKWRGKVRIPPNRKARRCWGWDRVSIQTRSWYSRDITRTSAMRDLLRRESKVWLRRPNTKWSKQMTIFCALCLTSYLLKGGQVLCPASRNCRRSMLMPFCSMISKLTLCPPPL